MSKPTREEMVKLLNSGEGRHAAYSIPLTVENRRILQAIREALTDSDIAHWMDRCHELEVKLAEKPQVSRERLAELCQAHTDGGMVGVLTELGIEVSDNSEVGRRTSDKEGE